MKFLLNGSLQLFPSSVITRFNGRAHRYFDRRKKGSVNLANGLTGSTDLEDNVTCDATAVLLKTGEICISHSFCPLEFSNSSLGTEICLYTVTAHGFWVCDQPIRMNRINTMSTMTCHGIRWKGVVFGPTENMESSSTPNVTSLCLSILTVGLQTQMDRT